MTGPVSQTNQPIGAFGLGNSDKKQPQAGRFVVNPPFIKPYSVYDVIKDKDGFYKELLAANGPATTVKPRKKKSLFSKILWAAVIIGGGILAYKKCPPIKDFVLKTYDKIKNYIKK